jgi:rare lipoprotein A
MKQVSIRAAGLLAAFWFASGQEALADCGFAGTYTPESRTAYGASSNHLDISAAHPSLPRGTRVVVRNQQKGRSIIVRIVDHGLIGLGQIIDLSAGAMHALGMETPAPVCVEVVSYGSESRGYRRIAMRNPFEASSGRHYAKARTLTRLAYGGPRRKHLASVRHGKGKRYAEVHRQPGRRSNHGRLAA